MTTSPVLDALRDVADLYRKLDQLDHHNIEPRSIRAALAKLHEDIGDALASIPTDALDLPAHTRQPTARKDH